ncbi:MAG TPA: membrane protein insertase YidC [Terriglobales bacterium]|nr:membrane protein insertase YidC [Terriglobales bacterium]
MTDFQNPQQDPGLERRLLLVFALTFLVILALQPLLMKKVLPQQPKGPEKKTAQTAPSVSQPPAPVAAAPAAAVQPAHKGRRGRAAAAEQPVAPSKQAEQETTTVIENDLYRIAFTNKGGQVKSWILKKQTDDKGKPLELLNPEGAKFGLPMSFWTSDEGLRNQLNNSLYVASQTGTLHAPADVTFEYANGDLTVRKSFRFDHTYVVKVETSVVYKGAPTPAYLAWPAGFGDQTTPGSYGSARIAWQYNEKIQRDKAKSVSGGGTISGPFHWAGVEDQYFGAVFIPDHPETAAMVTLRNSVDIPKDPEHPNPNETTKEELLGAAVGSTQGPDTERVFVGPKAVNVLESVYVANGDLRGLIDFGFFGIIARPLFIWLRWMQQHWVSNWGWAIALQTLIITVLLLPLRISSMKSSLKMQKAAPQIKAIQEKYKKYSMRDPRRQQMNQEIADLYKKEGVNPVGGCLPLVIQMPFLIAYYAMLEVAIELRHAPWLWIHDLSSPDPWHMLPILIIISTLFVQRMTPAAGMDPTQQKMMNLMMPLFLGVISWNLAAGLCVYWVLSNGIGIVQQAVMNRTELGREMRAEMEKRARKKAKV